MKALVIFSCIALSQALTFSKTNILRKELISEAEAQPEPISPYAFSYTADATDGSSTRQESADASGVVRGSYSLVSVDGIKRIVNYIADENGFRAQVQTNEPGTESKSSADVIMQSSQLPAEEIALKYGPRPDELKPVVQNFGFKTFEQKPEILTFGVKSVPRIQPIIDQTLLKPKTLTEIPLQKTLLAEERPIPSFIPFPNFQTNLRPIETPIKLLSKIPRVHTLKTDLKPLGFEFQQKEELVPFVPQNYESF